MEDYYFKSLKNKGLLIFVANKDKFTILEEKFLDLNVGDKIKKVGNSSNGGMAVLNRESVFSPFVYYAGIREEKMHINSTKKDRLLMFRVREEDKPINILKSDDLYCAYIIIEDKENSNFELKVPDVENNTINIFQTIFTKY